MKPSRRAPPFVLAALGALSSLAAVGCAGTVERSGDRDAGADGATGDGGCPQWVLTDREETHGGELYTDLHRTFGPAGELVRVRENIRVGGHGSMRAFREYAYQWAPGALTVTRVDEPGDRTTYTLDGVKVVRRVVQRAGADVEEVSYTRDEAGRVIERSAVAVEGASDRCDYRYDEAGRLVESLCDGGEETAWRWEGAHLARRERAWGGGSLSVDEFRWDAAGRMVSERHDDGFGPDRWYASSYVYDAQGRLERQDSAYAGRPTPTPNQAFEYDALGRLTRAELLYGTDAPYSLQTWERDEEGRPSRLTMRGGVDGGRYTYEVSPGRVLVTLTADTSRSSWSYQCFATPARIAPEEPVLDVPVRSPIPEVEHYPVARHEY